MADLASLPTPVPNPVLHRRHVCSSMEELLQDAINRSPFLTTDSKSGSNFERVTIAGEPHIVKYVHVDDDWTMRSYATSVRGRCWSGRPG